MSARAWSPERHYNPDCYIYEEEKVGPRGGVKRFLWCKVHQSVAKGLAACEKYMAGA